jgi:predicted SAM-dependent methyltransferase
MMYVNLGCGARYHTDWLNFDFESDNKNIRSSNLLNGIPLADTTVDVIYHSHVLEHFSKNEALNFIKECYRVLKPNGIIRVVVPDLEQLAMEYIKSLNVVSEEYNTLNEANYRWSVIELLDQMVREIPGGEMLEFWKQREMTNEPKVIERVGEEFLRIRSFLNQDNGHKNSTVIPLKSGRTLKSRIKSYLFDKLRVNPLNLEVGNFRNGGEIHKWMYDRHSLSRLLMNEGFVDIQVKTAFHSNIPD